MTSVIGCIITVLHPRLLHVFTSSLLSLNFWYFSILSYICAGKHCRRERKRSLLFLLYGNRYTATAY